MLNGATAETPTALPASSAAPLECPHCDSGRIGRHDCDRCHGTGLVRCETRGCDEPATRTGAGDADLTFCEACGAEDDRTYAAYLASLCPAGHDHEWLKRNDEAFAQLEYVGVQHVAADETGPAEHLAVANCACGSSLCRVITQAEADDLEQARSERIACGGEAWSGGFAENH